MANNKRNKRPKNMSSRKKRKIITAERTRQGFKKRKRELEIIARTGQPQVKAKVARLEKKVAIGGGVASSWISALQWDPTRGIVLMALINGYLYDVPIPFKMFEQWYYALSKGTFFNRIIKHSKYYNRIKRVF